MGEAGYVRRPSLPGHGAVASEEEEAYRVQLAQLDDEAAAVAREKAHVVRIEK